MKINFKRGFTHQNFLKKISGGFTLIELLVVVAIIGILVSVVMVSLGGARSKGLDAGVQSNLHSVANQAELFYINNGGTYLASSGSAFGPGPATCPTYADGTSSMFAQDKTMAIALVEATNNGTTNSCFNSATAWAAAVGLKSNTNTSWCVDSMGATKQEAFAVDAAINAATFSCK